MTDRYLLSRPVAVVLVAVASAVSTCAAIALALKLATPVEPPPTQSVPVCVHVEPLPVCAPDEQVLNHLNWCIEELQTCNVMMGIDSDLDDIEEEGREL